MTQEDFVSLECAKLLKEKGFDEPCLAYYCGDTFSFVPSGWRGETAESIRQKAYLPYQGESYFAPTLYEAQKWLRQTHNSHIEILCYNKDTWSFNLYEVTEGLLFESGYDLEEHFTYESALNAGIIEALKLI